MLIGTTGHVVVCGMGKSGLIGRKIAATLASTGTPSLFLHPAEAIHGDLGMVRSGDVMILISNSGETEEIVRLAALQRLDARIIALTAGPASSMARAAEIVLDISVDREACPLNPGADNLGDEHACAGRCHGGGADGSARVRGGGFRDDGIPAARSAAGC